MKWLAVIALFPLTAGCNVFLDIDDIGSATNGTTGTIGTTVPDTCGDAVCPDTRAVCVVDTSECVECVVDFNCLDGWVCRAETNQCVECLIDSDCNGMRTCTNDFKCKK